MDQEALKEAIDRVKQMEACFDALVEDANRNPLTIDHEKLQILLHYYEGGQWLRDYELDEKGFFPRELKRGVLSQDAVYDYLSQIRSQID